MFFKSLAAAAGLVTLSQAVSLSENRPAYSDECPKDSGYTSVVVKTKVVQYPGVINQFFEENTSIVINGGVTINVNNAPTSIVTSFTATSTETTTETSVVTVTATVTV
jgi:hypothetical protein